MRAREWQCTRKAICAQFLFGCLFPYTILKIDVKVHSLQYYICPLYRVFLWIRPVSFRGPVLKYKSYKSKVSLAFETELMQKKHTLYEIIYTELWWWWYIFLLVLLVKPTNYVDPYGALTHLHKIPYHLSLLGSCETF